MSTMVVPWQGLSEDALMGLIEEFVTREGTDYGHQSVDLDVKVRQVKKQLITGEAIIVFDPDLDSASIVPKEGFG